MVMLSILALISFSTLVQAMGVIGIDYGTESMKVSLVKPGQPFDVVLSRDSKRKIPSAVAWKIQERLFGTDAVNLATRYPGDTFLGAKFLLGRAYNDEKVKDRQRHLLGTKLVSAQHRNHSTISLERETDYSTNKEGAEIYTAEEVVGMQLSHAKVLAEEQAGEEVIRTYPGNIGTFGGLDVVVTVPIFFTASERQAVLDAANIAGMKARLLSDGAAVAVNYAMTRSFPKPEKHLFYDSGAGSTTATLVEFSTKTIQAESILSIGSTQKEAIIIDVLASGWDRDANGLAIDLLIRDQLANQFQAKNGKKLSKPVKEQPRAMARLLKEANRVKHILSANAEANSAVEGLADEIDFRGKLSREELETIVKAAGLDSKFSQPVRDALKESKLSIKDLSSVILVGGMTRVPFVQAALQAAGVPDDKIAQNVNADEAAVMGAAYYGASFNPQFRMKTIKTNDGNAYPVVLIEKGRKEEVIFPKGPMENPIHFREYTGITEDFSFDLRYDDSVTNTQLDDGIERPIHRIEVVEIDSHLKSIKEKGELHLVDTHVNVTIEARSPGVYGVENAWLHVKVKQKDSGVVGALKNFFNVGVNSILDDDDDDLEDAIINNGTETDNATSTNGTTTKSKKEKSKRTIPTERTIRLIGRAIPQGSVHPMSGSEHKTAQDRLYVADVVARKKANKEEARNVLEGYVYRVRDLVEEEWFKKASKEEERNAITSKQRELSEWLNSPEGDKADTSALKLKKGSLESLVTPVEKRVSEKRVRGKAVSTLEKTQKQARLFLQEARANLTAAMENNLASKYSVSELDTFQTQLDKDSKWFEEKKAAQDKRGLDEDPAFKSDEVERRSKKINDTINRYKKRRVPKTRPQKKEKDAKDAKKVKEEEKNSTAEEKVKDKKEKVTKEEKTKSGDEKEGTHVPPRHEEL